MNQTSIKAGSHRSWGLLALTGLLIVVLAFVAMTFFLLAREARHEQAWARLITESQVAAQQLSRSAAEAARGNVGAIMDLTAAQTRLDAAIRALESGASEDRVPPVPRQATEHLADLAASWEGLAANASRIRTEETMLTGLAEASDSLVARLPELQTTSERVAARLLELEASVRQVATADQLSLLAERMARQAQQLLVGGVMGVNSANELRGELEGFTLALNALQEGSAKLGVGGVRDAEARAALSNARRQLEDARPALETLLTASARLLEIRGAADEIFLQSGALIDKADALSTAIAQLPKTRPWPSVLSGVSGLVVLLVIAGMLLRSVIAAERRRARSATSRDEENQRAVKQLVKELGSLAQGDLRVQATVANVFTREIATATNYAVQRLRELVAGINETARAVSESAQVTRDSAARQAEAAGQQAEHMGEATGDIGRVAASLDTMARQSQDSSEVAHKSVEIAGNGAEKVRQTIKGMDLIRDQIQETSKRIKRLGESTQEIGDIVGIINGIAEQTNVLALNAAIQAASSGGAGKGFAMVADEVQELAESATHATRRIESLVQTIQADTSEAVHSMESTTSEVVRGANLAEDAGAALEQIEKVSNDLAEMIHAMSSEAQAQSEIATQISDLVTTVQEGALEISRGSKQTAETIDQLAELVLQLSASVSDFKLPAASKGKAG